MRMLLLWICSSLTASSRASELPAPAPTAQPTEPPALAPGDPLEALRFGDWLASQGDYAEARGAYRLQIFRTPGTPWADRATYSVGWVALVSGDPDLARTTFNSFLAGPGASGSPFLHLVAMGLADSARLGGDPAMATNLYLLYRERWPDDPMVPRALGLASLTLSARGYYEEALATLPPTAPPEARVILEAADARHPRRAGIAGALSLVLPGTGQLYAGHPGEAVSAFLVNAVLAGGTVYAAREEEWAGFGVLAFLGAGFWLGNVYGAMDGARQSNRHHRDDVVLSLEPILAAEPIAPPSIEQMQTMTTATSRTEAPSDPTPSPPAPDRP